MESTRRTLPVASIALADEKSILSERLEKPYRLTTFIVTFCEGILTSVDIQQFIELGLHIISFKMSNVTRTDKIKLLAMLKSAVKGACRKYDVSTWPIAISIDLPSATIRTGVIRADIGNCITLKENDVTEITSNDYYINRCSAEKIYIDDKNTLKIIKPGQEIVIVYSDISLVCMETNSQFIRCKVIKGGVLRNREHIIFRGLPNLKEDIATIDIELIEFAKEFELDIVTINYVRQTSVVQRVRNLFPIELNPLVISTICDQQGLDNIDVIIQESDGIILAREFLVFQISNKYSMHAIELQISAKCQKVGKPFFVSGNILEKTLMKGKLSYSELSDITNAVLHKSGFVLKNYCDAENLLKSLKILDSVCRFVESMHKIDSTWKISTEIDTPVNAAEACLSACALTAKQVGALVIVLTTVTGRTAARLSLIAPDAIVLAVTSKPAVARKLRFYRGLIPIIYDKEREANWYEETVARVRFAVCYGIKNELLKYGYTFVALRKSHYTSSFADNISIWNVSVAEEHARYSHPQILDRPCNRFRRCPVIVTLSDTQITPVEIQKLLEVGMNVAKFKMSFTTKGDRIRMLGKVDKAALACCRKFGVHDWPVATCIELKTCIVKTGLLENNADFIAFKEGMHVVLTCRLSHYNKCSLKKVFVDNPTLAKDIKEGTEISIGSDEVIMKCEAILDEENIKCIVVKGGQLGNVCNVCARGVAHNQPIITKKDLDMVKFALQYQIDMIIVNYVRKAETLTEIKKYMGKMLRPLIFGGVCTQEGLENIDDIIKECDGIILSREFLPFEIDVSQKFRLAHIQKWVCGKCMQAGKPFYLSGGVFKEALKTGLFYDNEISDVVNALMDGVSGFILRDCFNVDNTYEVLHAINETCYFVEPIVASKSNFWRILDEAKSPINAAEAAVMSCALVANQTKSRVIIVPTVTGKTLKALHRMRPACLVISLSKKISVLRLLHTYRSVMPLMYKESPESSKNWQEAIERRIDYAIEYAVQRGWLVYGDMYVTLQRGSDDSSFCDMVRVWIVRVSKKLLVE
ncbi:uncharacterized protein LOC119840613 [Zerene cesonia]|uniref:uncharacterized protein LOC119840613 n=1 Tax=Zerene cesonia TaxID=33412 RepID=UPI0018E563D8|nr:uncharacterized protein LOC119840613 [Zerene cesonia]